jgi:hypothetical protein
MIYSSVFLDLSRLDILGWTKFFMKYYIYLRIGLILLILMGSCLETNVQNGL